MKANFKRQEKYFVDAQMFMLENTLPWSKKPGKMKYLMGSIVIVLGILNLYFFFKSSSMWSLVIGVACIVFGLFNIKFTKSLYISSFKKYDTLNEGVNLFVEIDDNEVKTHDEYLTIIAKTSQTKKIYETKEYFYLQVTKGMIVYIPKESVDVDQVRTELQSYASKYNFEYVIMS